MNQPDSSYFEGERFEMQAYIPSDVRTSLEIGCGAGKFSLALKQQLSLVAAWGVEIMPEFAKKADGVLDKVLVGDAEQLLDQLPDDYFDLLVFNDSLEHLVDPYSLLKKIKPKLKKGGSIIASIPNVRYYTNLYNLIFKAQWHYEDSGILDRTHLRFFTQSSIHDLFTAHGYEVTTLEGINECRKVKVRIWGWLTGGRLTDIKYLQFAVVAKNN